MTTPGNGDSRCAAHFIATLLSRAAACSGFKQALAFAAKAYNRLTIQPNPPPASNWHEIR
jgi:hypothetical protein